MLVGPHQIRVADLTPPEGEWAVALIELVRLSERFVWAAITPPPGESKKPSGAKVFSVGELDPQSRTPDSLKSISCKYSSRFMEFLPNQTSPVAQNIHTTMKDTRPPIRVAPP